MTLSGFSPKFLDTAVSQQRQGEWYTKYALLLKNEYDQQSFMAILPFLRSFHFRAKTRQPQKAYAGTWSGSRRH